MAEFSKYQFLLAVNALMEAKTKDEINEAIKQIGLALDVIRLVAEHQPSEHQPSKKPRNNCQYCGIDCFGSYCSTRCNLEGKSQKEKESLKKDDQGGTTSPDRIGDDE